MSCVASFLTNGGGAGVCAMTSGELLRVCGLPRYHECRVPTREWCGGAMHT